MKKRKKGALAIYSIFVILTILILSSIMINLMQGMQMATRMKQAAAEGAQVRAQAIDVLLKEDQGVVDILHSALGYSDNVDHTQVDIGNETPALPSSLSYQLYRQKADDDARQAVLNFVNHSLYKDVSGHNNIVTLNTGDVCFDIKPLSGNLYDGFDPSTATPAQLDGTSTINFSCTTPNGTTISANNVVVSDIHHNTVKLDTKNGNVRTVRAANVVFVGIHFTYTYYISNMMANFGLSKTNTANVYAVAYPQVDKCVRSDATCTY